MLTQKGNNTHVYGIDGNFDDAQTGVKRIFNDKNFAVKLAERGYRLSSANSINIGRLIPQIAYYVWAYGQMIKKDRRDAVNEPTQSESEKTEAIGAPW